MIFFKKKYNDKWKINQFMYFLWMELHVMDRISLVMLSYLKFGFLIRLKKIGLIFYKYFWIFL